MQHKIFVYSTILFFIYEKYEIDLFLYNIQINMDGHWRLEEENKKIQVKSEGKVNDEIMENLHFQYQCNIFVHSWLLSLLLLSLILLLLLLLLLQLLQSD